MPDPLSRSMGETPVDSSTLATGFSAQLPAWVLDEVAADAAAMPDVEDRMRLAHRLADRNYREGTGGPFAAVVCDPADGSVVSVGVNLVLAGNLSSLHAEVVAISLAQVKLGTWDLGGHNLELVVNWRPCAMCYGATLWSGVTRLVIAGEGDVVEELTGFDEGPMREDWKQQFAQRGIEVRTDVLRDEAIATFRGFRDAGATVYNGRRSPLGP